MQITNDCNNTYYNGFFNTKKKKRNVKQQPIMTLTGHFIFFDTDAQ